MEGIMKKKLSLLIVLASTVILIFALNLGVASAHGNVDGGHAGLTPLGGESREVLEIEEGVDFFGGLGGGNANNSRLKNPTCGAHTNGDEHPGNPNL